MWICTKFLTLFSLSIRTVSPLGRGQWHDDIAAAPVDVPRLLHQRLLEWADNLVDCRLVVNIFECLVERKGGRHFLRTECSDRLKLNSNAWPVAERCWEIIASVYNSHELLHHWEGSCGQRWRTWWDSIGNIINFVSEKKIYTISRHSGVVEKQNCANVAA